MMKHHHSFLRTALICFLLPAVASVSAQPIAADPMVTNNVVLRTLVAGNPEKPTILLLHGFPSSSHMYRELMPELADEYHLIAPDFPAFGQTDSPDREHFTYSFYHLARIVDKFTELLVERHTAGNHLLPRLRGIAAIREQQYVLTILAGNLHGTQSVGVGSRT